MCAYPGRLAPHATEGMAMNRHRTLGLFGGGLEVMPTGRERDFDCVKPKSEIGILGVR